ncbi:MAG: cytochrome c [Ignavibacteria bacterium]|nr:cytochrome c [Ignavibacteria bacterium]
MNISKLAAKYTAFIIATIAILTTSANGQDKAALMKRGAEVYKAYCQTCHQATGKGLPNVYPPVAGSDYIKSKPKATIIDNVCNGLKGEVVVNGKKFNNVMVPLPANYTNDDAAAVITYVLNSWGNNGGIVSAAEVKKIRKVATPVKKK